MDFLLLFCQSGLDFLGSEGIQMVDFDKI
jgi:hypothetical protein